MTNDNEKRPKQDYHISRLAGPLLLVVILLLASLYAFGDLGNLLRTARGNLAGSDAVCRLAKADSARLTALATGEIAALQVNTNPALVRDLAFLNAGGERVTLSQFRGKTILLNLWATWCAPCRTEMPALDALQGALGGPDFEVVAVNIDTRNFEKPRQFLDEVKALRLAYYVDPSAKIFQDLKAAGRAFGMPTTLVIDKNGCERAHLSGPAEWSSPEALSFMRAAIR